MTSVLEINSNNRMAELCREIEVNGDRLVKDIKSEFNLLYPFLKIEFLKREVSNSSASNKVDKVGDETPIKQLSTSKSRATISLESYRTIQDLENDFHNLLGIHIQVLRKSGNVWNIISLTDAWTLESQNKAGEFISSEMKP